jgi:hypothetical protein
MCGRRPRVKGFFWFSARGRVQVMCPACGTREWVKRCRARENDRDPICGSHVPVRLDVTSHSECQTAQAAAAMATLLERAGAR